MCVSFSMDFVLSGMDLIFDWGYFGVIYYFFELFLVYKQVMWVNLMLGEIL